MCKVKDGFDCFLDNVLVVVMMICLAAVIVILWQPYINHRDSVTATILLGAEQKYFKIYLSHQSHAQTWIELNIQEEWGSSLALGSACRVKTS